MGHGSTRADIGSWTEGMLLNRARILPPKVLLPNSWKMMKRITFIFLIEYQFWHYTLKKSNQLHPIRPITHSVQLSYSVVSDSSWPHESQHARPPCPSPTPGVYSNSCSLSWWCHPTISSFVAPFSSCPQSFSVSESSNEWALCIRWSKY